MTTYLFLGLGTQELILIALVFLLLFGAQKLPDLMKGLAKGIKGFKQEMKEVKDEIKDEPKQDDSKPGKAD